MASHDRDDAYQAELQLAAFDEDIARGVIDASLADIRRMITCAQAMGRERRTLNDRLAALLLRMKQL